MADVAGLFALVDGVGTLSVSRNAPRRGFVRIRSGNSSRMEEKVKWCSMSLKNYQKIKRVSIDSTYPWVLNFPALYAARKSFVSLNARNEAFPLAYWVTSTTDVC